MKPKRTHTDRTGRTERSARPGARGNHAWDGRIEDYAIAHGDREARWIQAAVAGSAEAFDELVRAHHGRVLATATRLLGNHEDAEDVTQECFVRAHRALVCFRAEGSFAAWLRRILVHLVLDRFRSRGRGLPFQGQGEVDVDQFPVSGEPGDALDERELGVLVREAIGRLPDGRRVAFLLRVREGLAYAAIADALSITPATARTQVMKARRTLLALLERHLDQRLDDPSDRRRP